MAKKTIKAQMKQRRDTKANWAATNPVLLDGELGIVSDDPNLYKVGDGATAWNSLPFRGFDGTLAQELGTSPNAVISQKVVSEKLTELESESNRAELHISDIDIIVADYDNGVNLPKFPIILDKGDILQITPNLINITSLDGVYLNHTDGTKTTIYSWTSGRTKEVVVDKKTKSISFYYQGTPLEDYVKIHLVNNNLAKSEFVNSEIESLESELNKVELELNKVKDNELDLIFSVSVKNKNDYFLSRDDMYHRYENGELGQSANYETYYYKTKGIKSIAAVVRSKDKGVASISFFNDSTPSASSYMQSESLQSKGHTYGDLYMVDIPNDAVVVGISNYKKEGTYEVGFIADGIIAKQQEDIDKIQSDLLEFESVVNTEDYIALVEDFYIRYEDGVKFSSVNWDCYVYENKGYSQCTLKAYSSDSVSASIAFYNSTTISSESYLKESSVQSFGEYGQHSYIDIPIPKDAKIIVVSNRTATGNFEFSCQIDKPIKVLLDEVSELSKSVNNYQSVISPEIVYVAHRGVHLNFIAPENSIDSIRLAALAGFDACELDLKKTKDGHFVIAHLSNIRYDFLNSDGTTINQDVIIEDSTFDYLRNNFVLRTPNVSMRKPIPTFEEVLTACKMYGITPYIDCKIIANEDAQNDSPILLNMVRRYYGTDKIYWGNMYATYIRLQSRSKQVNCGIVDSKTPQGTSEYLSNFISKYANADGENSHTNFSGYVSDNPYFTADNIAKYNEAGIKYGVFETGVNPNFDNLLKKGINLLVSDYTAPKANNRMCTYYVDSFDDYVTTGSVENGVLSLLSGQSVKLKEILPKMNFAGVYVSFEMNGTITFKSKGYSSDGVGYSDINISGDNANEVYVFNHMLHDLTPDVEIVATSDTKITRLSVAVIEYL